MSTHGGYSFPGLNTLFGRVHRVSRSLVPSFLRFVPSFRWFRSLVPSFLSFVPYSQIHHTITPTHQLTNLLAHLPTLPYASLITITSLCQLNHLSNIPFTLLLGLSLFLSSVTPSWWQHCIPYYVQQLSHFTLTAFNLPRWHSHFLHSPHTTCTFFTHP